MNERQNYDEVRRETQARTYEKLYERLNQWKANSASLADDDFIPPTEKSISTTRTMLERFQKIGFPVPNRMCPSGDGEICIDYWLVGTEDSSSDFSIMIEKEGGIEGILFDG